MSKQKIFKTGNSLGISIPYRLVKKLGISAGQSVVIIPQPDQNKMVIEFVEASQLPFAQPE